MPLINQAIAALWNGISQQAAALRQPAQAELSENFYPTVADGIAKRPPFKYLGTLPSVGSTYYGALPFVESFSLGKGANYILQLSGKGTFKVSSASYPEGSLPVDVPADVSAYLTSYKPAEDFAIMTVADTTFILNKSLITLPQNAAAPATVPAAGYVVFKNSGAGVSRNIKVSVETYWGTYTATYSGNDQSIQMVMNTIASAFNSGPGASHITCTQQAGNILCFTAAGTGHTVFNVTVTDDYGSSCASVIQGTVKTYGELPNGLPDGYVAYVSPDPSKQGKGFYVKYDKAAGNWAEIAKPGQETAPLASRMPLRLVRTYGDNFRLEMLPWAPRKAGDTVSNPDPTFFNQRITDMVFYRDRLGFLSGDSVILSEAGNYWNFYAASATAVTDADPIDVSVGSGEVSDLIYGVPFNRALLLFSSGGQSQLTGGDVLSPKNVRVDPLTSFEVAATCRPAALGNNLYFAASGGSYSQLREYFVQQDALVNDAADITAHVPRFLPSGVRFIAASGVDDLLVVGDRTNTLYGYKFLWSGDQKVQSAWWKWNLPAGFQLVSGRFFAGVLYVFVKPPYEDSVMALSLNPSAAASDHETIATSAYLDMQWAINPGDVITTAFRTELKVPHKSILPTVFITEGPGAGSTVPCSWITGYPYSAVAIPAEYNTAAGHRFTVGYPYTARYRLSQQFLRDAKNDPIQNAVVKLRRLAVDFLRAKSFRVEVTPPGRATNNYTFAGNRLGEFSSVTSAGFSDGTVRMPVMSDTRGVKIDLVVDDPCPCTFQRIEWEGEAIVGANRA